MYALARGYLARGRCEGGAAPLGKIVLGLPGDTVWVSQDSIRHSGGVPVFAPLQRYDRQGRRMDNAQGLHVLRSDECFVVSTFNLYSYDSRYFGPVTCEAPFVVLQPLASRAKRQLAPLQRAVR